jgi:hypothetical protein
MVPRGKNHHLLRNFQVEIREHPDRQVSGGKNLERSLYCPDDNIVSSLFPFVTTA